MSRTQRYSHEPSRVESLRHQEASVAALDFAGESFLGVVFNGISVSQWALRFHLAPSI